MADNKPKVLPGANDAAKLEALTQKVYKDQVIWFLNAFWDDFGEKEAENIWKFTLKYQDLDLEKKAEGNGLDELNAHRFLEFFKETLTVHELRDRLRETGAIAQTAKPKTVPITHFLLFKYNTDFHTLVNASQGDNAKEIAEAQRKLDEVSKAFEVSEARAKEASAAYREAESREREAVASEKEARDREADAKAREAEAIEREAPFKQAQQELEAALAELKAQEDAYNSKKSELQKKSEEGSVVQQNKAKNELAQLLAEDPLPLRRAKITQEAATKKAEKARAPFEAATKTAEAARRVAEEAAAEASASRHVASEAKSASERAKEAADAAVEESRRRLQEAEDYLTELNSRPGSAKGFLWWLERELQEKKKYLPERKGGVRKADA
eukprot:TRINITY_DN9_c0_g1_i1.p1 TRINITY_DN9_c0_g1~~TRINITY_DN9_c0_g1_i1.p1  ORF type:complete len:385 (-),score=130.31 TRINITY_DN9_c0_g1_i1:53-1207(-)